jgi:hypothetical protein
MQLAESHQKMCAEFDDYRRAASKVITNFLTSFSNYTSIPEKQLVIKSNVGGSEDTFSSLASYSRGIKEALAWSEDRQFLYMIVGVRFPTGAHKHTLYLKIKVFCKLEKWLLQVQEDRTFTVEDDFENINKYIVERMQIYFKSRFNQTQENNDETTTNLLGFTHFNDY